MLWFYKHACYELCPIRQRNIQTSEVWFTSIFLRGNPCSKPNTARLDSLAMVGSQPMGVNPDINQEWGPSGGWMPTLTSFRQLLQPSWCQTYRSAFLWTTSVRPRGIPSPGHPRISVHFAQACTPERSLVSYRPPQAGQPPASKVPTRHGLPASMGA